MSAFGLAMRTFFRIFKDKDFAGKISQLSEAEDVDSIVPPVEQAPARSEALTLLATLQREARLVDFLMEDLDAYSDAQVGAAARDVHRDSAAVLKRLFAPTALRQEGEGQEVQIPAGFDPTEVRLTGNVSGDAPYRGLLRHHGWKAEQCELPTWDGADEASLVLGAAEVELP